MAFADSLSRASIMNVETAKKIFDTKTQNSFLRNQIAQQRFDTEINFLRQQSLLHKEQKEAERKAKRKRNITYAALGGLAAVGGIAALGAAGTAAPAAGGTLLASTGAPVAGGVGGLAAGTALLPGAFTAVPGSLGLGAGLSAFGSGALGTATGPLGQLALLGGGAIN